MHQVLFVESGVFLFEDEHTRQVLFGEKIAYIPPNFTHRVFSIGKEVRFHSLYFQSKYELSGVSSIRFFYGSNLLRELIVSLEIHKKKSEVRSICLELFNKLLEEEVLEEVVNHICLPNAKEKRNQQIISYIDENFHQKIKLNDFQNVLPLSTRQIDRIFQSELKISPMEYLRLKRIQMSVVFLKTTNLSIVEIALECGFESLSSFYENFEEIFHTSPKKFQRGEVLIRNQ